MNAADRAFSVMVDNSEHPGEEPAACGAGPSRLGSSATGKKNVVRSLSAWWFRPVILLMVAGFFLVVHQRDRIRAHWWAWQLANSAPRPNEPRPSGSGSRDDLSRQAHYLGLLIGAGEAGAGAVESLARHERADVRALAVVALARLRGERGVTGLCRLLADEDADVAESAATALAFLDDQRGLSALVEAIGQGREPPPPAGPAPGEIRAATDRTRAATVRERSRAAAAAAGLARLEAPQALGALCDAASSHPDALVRAQAVESLAVWLMAAAPPEPPRSRGAFVRDPPRRIAAREAHGLKALSADRQAAALHGSTRPGSVSDDEAAPCDPIAVLVAALDDRGEIEGTLSLERQIAAAEAATRGVPGTPGWPARVGEASALDIGCQGHGDAEPEHSSPGTTARPEGRGSSLVDCGFERGVRTVGEVAAKNLERLIGRRIETGPPRTAAEQAELAAKCRAWWRAALASRDRNEPRP